MYDRIFVAYDGSHCSEQALQEALRLGKDQHAALLVVHVLDESVFYRYPTAGVDIGPLLEAWRQGGREILQQAVSAAEREGVPIETELVETGGQRVPDILTDMAKNWSADLVVMGTHARHGVQHLLLGSVAEGVIRRASIPILVVHSPTHHGGGSEREA
jgi:nucleotide-binding universal stress UspA family protein